jgi:RHS repeat-associated protein
MSEHKGKNMKRLNAADARSRITHMCSVRQAAMLALSLFAGVSQAATTTITYTYDAGDHVTSVTDPRGLVTSYVYDGLGHLWQQSSPDTGTTSYSYDGNGRRASMTRANGVQTTYTYDAIGRVTVLSAGGQSQRFTYDSCANGLGRMCTAADANGSVGYSYTPEGWISGRAFTVGSTSYTVGYAYNAMGQVVTVVYPDGNQALYNYTNGVVSSVSLNIGGAGRTAASQITYQPQDNAMASWVGSNGITTSLYYDTDGRFTGANVPGVLTYGVYYDNAGRIIRKQDFISPILTESFGYDDQSRLVSVQGGAENEAYQYDANGNRIAQTVNGTSMTLVYEGGSNRMINAGGVTFGYDAMGNSSVANGISRWQFDPFNRMTTAFGNTYYIDPLGQRLMKSVGSATTYFAPGEGNHLMAENDSGLWVDYLWLNGRLIARIHGGQVEDIHLDQVGRPEAMTNADQTLAWRAMNTPFTRSVATNNAVPLNIGFPGQYYDTELSLWNNGYRDYFPWVGRYLESDPIGLAGGINTYGYVGGNPLDSVDPYGLVKIPGVPGANGENSINANPGPEATPYRAEHDPPHIHLGSNDGPRVSTDTFLPLSEDDARRMTRGQKKFCEGLSAESKELIRLRQRQIFKFGRVIEALDLASPMALDSLTASCRQDPFFCIDNFPGVLESFGEDHNIPVQKDD